MSRNARYEDERFIEFAQDTLPGIGDCDPDWPAEPPPRRVRNVIRDLADYQSSPQP